MLTDTQVRQAKPKDKNYRLYDERGMYLEISPSGGKLWRFKYRFQAKEKRISLGRYPEISLSQARERREEARKSLANGIDPSAQRQAQKVAATLAVTSGFEVVAEWFAKQAPNWAKTHAATVISRLEKDIFPWLGDRPISDITAPELLAVLRNVESRGALETAHRELGVVGQIFRYAIATGRVERDISRDLQGALPPVKNSHFAAITNPQELGRILKILDSYRGGLVVNCALKLAPMVFVRPGELRTAKWADIDFEKAEWRFQASKTKIDHIVPLSRQAIAILRELQPLTGRGEFVFPNGRTTARPMTENAVLAALRSLGIEKDEMTSHGLRATASA